MSATAPRVPFLDQEWLCSKGSDAARLIRLMAEHAHPMERLAREKVNRTVLFFGSARGSSASEWEVLKADALEAGDRAECARLDRTRWMCEWHAKSLELARRVAEWQKVRWQDGSGPEYVIATGGGPGLMAAANEGARIGGARSMGVAVTLPFEKGLNAFVDEALAFRLHYFSTRKMVLADRACGIVALPGGLGTLDELFELATLVQTGKVGGLRDPWKAHMPMVLLGGDAYWRRVLNLDAAVELGTISQEDADRMVIADDVEEAFEALTSGLLRVEAAWAEARGDGGTPAASASAGRGELAGVVGLRDDDSGDEGGPDPGSPVTTV